MASARDSGPPRIRDPTTRLWTLYARDRNDRRLEYPFIEPAPDLAPLIRDLDSDPTCIFWASIASAGLQYRYSVSSLVERFSHQSNAPWIWPTDSKKAGSLDMRRR